MNSLPLALNYTLKVPPNLDHLMFPIFVTRQIHYTENEQTMSLGHKYTIFYLQWLATLTYYWISIVECKLSAYLCRFIRLIHIVCLRRYWTPEERTSELFLQGARLLVIINISWKIWWVKFSMSSVQAMSPIIRVVEARITVHVSTSVKPLWSSVSCNHYTSILQLPIEDSKSESNKNKIIVWLKYLFCTR